MSKKRTRRFYSGYKTRHICPDSGFVSMCLYVTALNPYKPAVERLQEERVVEGEEKKVVL